MADIHDSGYKFLFSNRTIFRQLMESFVDQPWVAQLDFERAETVDKSFIDKAFQERESDLIYRIPFGEEELYVYVLLEFQSTVDRSMALRVLNYVVQLYMHLDENRTGGEKLPPVFPLVLYNGDRHWTAATDVADLIEPIPALGEYGLHFRYFKLAENELDRERLLRIGNIVSTLFLAETRYAQDKLIEELVALFEREEDKQAVSMLVNWFRQMAIHKRMPGEDYKELEEVYRSSEEVKTMFVTALEEYGQEFYVRGREEGREEGLEKGLEKGRFEIILAMSRRGFAVDVIADVTGIAVADVEAMLARGLSEAADAADFAQQPDEPDAQ